MTELRYYQNEAKEAVLNGLKEGKKKQLLVMPGGTGKTKCACNITKDMGRIAWITHEESLAEQSAIVLLDENDIIAQHLSRPIIEQAGGLVELINKYNRGERLVLNAQLICRNIGLVKADLFDINKPIVVCSAQTLWRRLDRIPPNWFQVVVADEGDLFGSKTFKQPLDYLQPNLLLGLTGTPYRSDNMLMEDIFDCIIYEYPIGQAIKDKYLTELNAIVIKTSVNLDDVHTSMGDFNQKELTDKINTDARNYLIVNKYLEYCKGQQFICFGADVQHVIDLNACFLEKGIKTAYAVSDKDKMIVGTDRKTIVAQYRKGEIIGLINYNLWGAGFDHPDCGAVLLACPTKSKRKFLQQLYRVTRLKSSEFVEKFGQIGTILDIVDGTSKHILINTRELDKGKEIEDRVFVSEANKKLLIEAREARERKFNEEYRKEDKNIKLFQLPQTKISTSFRMQETATEKQLAWIKNLGYDIENESYTKEMCSRIISDLPAPKSCVDWLAFKKYDVQDRVVTRGEFEAARKEVERREEKSEREKRDRIVKNNIRKATGR